MELYYIWIWWWN
jgi:hypothetical protein